jgi:hypothetical protein
MTGYPAGGETACSNGGGGQATAGVTLPRPAWQTGPGVPAGVNRLVPDISMHYGSCTTPSTGRPFLTAAGQFLWVVSGTSADAPLWAGYWAVANQLAGGNLGHAAPLLWRICEAKRDQLRVLVPRHQTGNIGVRGRRLRHGDRHRHAAIQQSLSGLALLAGSGGIHGDRRRSPPRARPSRPPGSPVLHGDRQWQAPTP